MRRRSRLRRTDGADRREDGLTGQSLDLDSPLPLTLDACAATPQPGIMNVFSAGPSARGLTRLAPAERRSVVIEALTRRFGGKAGRVSTISSRNWTAEP